MDCVIVLLPRHSNVGKLDVVAGSYYGAALAILEGDGTGNLESIATPTVGPKPYGIAIGDVDGDGIADVAAAVHDGNTVAVLRGTGDGALAPKLDYGTGSQPTGVVIGDFDGNHLPDLAVTGSASNVASVLLRSCVP